MTEGLDAAAAMLGMFGGVSLIIWTSMQAKVARIKAEAEARRTMAAPAPADTVLAELKAMRQQMEQVQNTSHGFDLSFDEALNRMEARVGRLETKSAAGASTAADAPATLRNGLGQ